MMNPVQTADQFAAKLEGLAHALSNAKASRTVTFELPADIAAEAPELLRAAANALKNAQAPNS